MTTDHVAPASSLTHNPTAAAAMTTFGIVGWARTSWTSWSTSIVGSQVSPRSVDRWIPPTCTFARSTWSSQVAVIDRTLSAGPTWCHSSRLEMWSKLSTGTRRPASSRSSRAVVRAREHHAGDGDQRRQVDVGTRQGTPRAVSRVLPHLALIDDGDPRVVGSGSERSERVPVERSEVLPG